MKDREVIIAFESCKLSGEERIEAKSNYHKAERAQRIPIGVQMKFANYVMSEEYVKNLYEIEAHLENIWGLKERTARGYSIIIVAAKWIHDMNSEHFKKRGFPWDKFMTEYLIDTWGPIVKHCIKMQLVLE